MIAEACLIFKWTTREALETPAQLFFAMLKEGREIRSREKFRGLYHLLSVSSYPHTLTDTSRKDVSQYFWDMSLSEQDLSARHEFKERVEKEALETAEKAGSVAAHNALTELFGGARG